MSYFEKNYLSQSPQIPILARCAQAHPQIPTDNPHFVLSFYSFLFQTVFFSVCMYSVAPCRNKLKPIKAIAPRSRVAGDMLVDEATVDCRLQCFY